jgi:hypothetical protein
MQRSRSDWGLAKRRAVTAARDALALALAFCGLVYGTSAAAANAESVVGRYFSAPFHATQLTYSFGQAPSWARNGDVLSTQFDSAGIEQIYRSLPDGSEQACLTCTTVQGPNGLPQERPEGDWILFESFAAQPAHIGNPGLGGYGSDLYVMQSNGSRVYRLTTTSDPNHGVPFTASSGVAYDNFHAYWSPDGAHIIWTHTEANPFAQSGQTWSIMLGDFTVNRGKPELTDVRVVGKPYGAYETQPWSPDGKGFLFFASGGYNSPFQAEPPGWGNARLYYMRIYGAGASPEDPRVTLIGDNEPVYQEQAIFTPDMKDVVEMSNRGSSLGSWYDLIASAAQHSAFDAPETGTSQTLQFLADFDGSDFHSDLWEVDLKTGAFRRLTNLNGVIPEFYWNRSYTKILWSLGGSGSHSYIGSFEHVPHGRKIVPSQTPPWLYGEPVDMERVGTQAQPIRDPGPTSNASEKVDAPESPAPAFPHAETSRDKVTIPAVLLSYLELWTGDLSGLGKKAKLAFSVEPPTRVGVG